MVFENIIHVTIAAESTEQCFAKHAIQGHQFLYTQGDKKSHKTPKNRDFVFCRLRYKKNRTTAKIQRLNLRLSKRDKVINNRCHYT